MCGRYIVTADPAQMIMAFDTILPNLEFPEDIPLRYNVAPTQPVMVIPNNTRQVDFFLWGLIPSWSKDMKRASQLINARSETVHEKPSFRAPFKRRRCLIPATGFYEWIKVPGQAKKQPYLIQMESKEPFAFAGIWDAWQSPEGDTILSTSILTTEPNDYIAKLHNRMPVILKPKDYDLWLTEDEIERGDVEHVFEAYPAEEFYAYKVSTRVNSPGNDGPENIAPIE